MTVNESPVDPAVEAIREEITALDLRLVATLNERIEAVERLRAGRTTFIVAHRLSSVRDADEILVMEGGRIVERGSHAALLENAGLYARLYNTQTQ